MSKFCCITDIIRFIMKEAENLMKGSVHEDYFFIVHDDLVLMTAKEKIERMKEKNYFHRWFLPIIGLQDGTTYAGRPVGNSPKFMPLYNSLNRDILHCLRFHYVLSRFVLDGGELTRRIGICNSVSQHQIHIFYNSRRRRGSHFRFPYTLDPLGDFP